MAWLQNLAGKAEDLLVKFDQNAANVFNEPNSKSLASTSTIANTIEPVQESLEPENASPSNFAALPEMTDNVPVIKDDVSINSEKSRTSNSGDEDVAVNTNPVGSIRDTPSPSYSIGNISRKENKSEYSGVSSKSGSLQNSYILMDDSLINYEEKLAKLARENEDFSQQFININHLYSQLQNENSNLQNQLERANLMVTSTQTELEQYRVRAQRVLQEKEKLISSQQSNTDLDPPAAEQVVKSYTNELKKELEFQENKCNELTMTLAEANYKLSTLHGSFLVAQKDHQISKQVLQDTIMNERKIRATIEEEYQTKAKELQSSLHEISQQNSIIANKTQENLQLQEQLKYWAHSSSNEDIEMRLHCLTQTLIAKQNTLETVTTEKNALRLQLERLESEHHKVIIQMHSTNIKNVKADPEEVKLHVPRFLRISPFDVGVTRRVKRAYSCLDTVSIRTGVFLRRYPFARVFVFCYMILLHLWVLVILFTYVPTSY